MDSLCEVNENIRPAQGGRTPACMLEIEGAALLRGGKTGDRQLHPHLVPMNRGILVTALRLLTGNASEEELRAATRSIIRRNISSAC